MYLCFSFDHKCIHQGHHLSTSPGAKTTCCQYWWLLLQYLCGLGSEVSSHRQSGVNGACVTLDKRLRALEQSQGHRSVCACVCYCNTPLFHSTLAGLILVYFWVSDLADNPFIRTFTRDWKAHQKVASFLFLTRWNDCWMRHPQHVFWSFYLGCKV